MKLNGFKRPLDGVSSARLNHSPAIPLAFLPGNVKYLSEMGNWGFSLDFSYFYWAGFKSSCVARQKDSDRKYQTVTGFPAECSSHRSPVFCLILTEAPQWVDLAMPPRVITEGWLLTQSTLKWWNSPCSPSTQTSNYWIAGWHFFTVHFYPGWELNTSPSSQKEILYFSWIEKIIKDFLRKKTGREPKISPS